MSHTQRYPGCCPGVSTHTVPSRGHIDGRDVHVFSFPPAWHKLQIGCRGLSDYKSGIYFQGGITHCMHLSLLLHVCGRSTRAGIFVERRVSGPNAGPRARNIGRFRGCVLAAAWGWTWSPNRANYPFPRHLGCKTLKTRRFCWPLGCSWRERSSGPSCQRRRPTRKSPVHYCNACTRRGLDRPAGHPQVWAGSCQQRSQSVSYLTAAQK